MTSAQIHPVTLIGGGPGAWDLITVRGMRALQDAEVILADHLGPTAQLDKLCDISSKELIDVSKLPYKKSISQEKINALLIKHARAGRKVARLRGATPSSLAAALKRCKHWQRRRFLPLLFRG